MKLIVQLGYINSFVIGIAFFIFTWIGVLLVDISGSQVYKNLESFFFQNTTFLMKEIIIKGLIAFIGIIVPAYFLFRIKCPACNYKIFISYYNHDFSASGFKKFLEMDTCPNCLYEHNKE